MTFHKIILLFGIRAKKWIRGIWGMECLILGKFRAVRAQFALFLFDKRNWRHPPGRGAGALHYSALLRLDLFGLDFPVLQTVCRVDKGVIEMYEKRCCSPSIV
jgi:hypothetical protein